jgi:multiple sugar transport system ATP-binding protein
VATPLECYHEPANVFVAGFLGEPSMNFFDVDSDGDTLVADAFEYPVSSQVAADIGDETELVLGIRPEAVKLVDSASTPHDFETRVDVVEPMGDENTVYLTFGDDMDESLVATTSGMRQLRREQSVVARLPEEAIHVFDRRTGRALHNRTVVDEDDTVADAPSS